MLRLELQHCFERVDRLVNLPQPFLSQAELEVQRADRGIDFLRLLKSLDRLLCLIQMQMPETHQIISSRAIPVETESLLALFDRFRVVPSQQISVRKVQMRIDAFRRQLDRFKVKSNGVGRSAAFEKAVASSH